MRSSSSPARKRLHYSPSPPKPSLDNEVNELKVSQGKPARVSKNETPPQNAARRGSRLRTQRTQDSVARILKALENNAHDRPAPSNAVPAVRSSAGSADGVSKRSRQALGFEFH